MGISLVKRPAEEEGTRLAVRVAFYMRVSTAEQELEGYSPEFQRAQLLEHVKRKEYKGWITRPEWHFFDVGSGSEFEGRAELQRLLECVRAGQVDIVLVWKIDRLSRSLSDLLRLFDEFSRHRVGFASTKEDLDFTGPIGRLIYQVFGALAEFERETIKMRTEEGRRASALAGNYTGTVAPYGFEGVPNPSGKGRRLQVVPHEADIVRQIFHWFIYEHWSTGRIADELNRLGIPKGKANRTSGGTRWRDFTVRTMIGSEEYRGVFITNRYRLVQKKPRRHEERPKEEWIVVRMPAIVDDMLFYMAQERLQETSRVRQGGGGQEQYILRGKLVEVGTGRGFVGYRSTKKTKNYRRKPFVAAGICYPSMSIAAKPLEEFVWAHIERAIRDPDEFLDLHRKNMAEGRQKDMVVQRLRLYEDQVSELNRRIEKVNADFYAGRIPEEERQKWLDRFHEEREASVVGQHAAVRELAAMGRYEAACQDLRQFAEQFRGALGKLGDGEKRALVELLLERVEISESEEGRTARALFRFDPKNLAQAMPRVEPDLSRGRPRITIPEVTKTVSGASDGEGYFLFAFETMVGYLGSNQHQTTIRPRRRLASSVRRQAR